MPSWVPNFNGCTVEVWKWLSDFILHFAMNHYNDVILGTMASQITRLAMVYSTVCSRKCFRLKTSSWCNYWIRSKCTQMDSAKVRNRWAAMTCANGDIIESFHGDVIKWKHFPRNWPFVRGIHLSRWIPHTKACDPELWGFLWSTPE